MTCDKIMLRDAQTIGPDDTVPKAVSLMRDYGVRSIPVVDGDGKYLGSFKTIQLIKLLLPTVATIEGGLADLSFVHDPVSYIRRRYKEIATHRVGDFIDPDAPTVAPDTSVTEAMLKLYKHRTHLPVIDPETQEVMGVVTVNSVLETIIEGES